jgi:hypothetical protein
MGTSESLTLPATTTMPSLSTAAGAAAAADAHFSGILLEAQRRPNSCIRSRFHGEGGVLGKIQLHPARRARASFSSLIEDKGAGKMHMLVAKNTYERD